MCEEGRGLGFIRMSKTRMIDTGDQVGQVSFSCDEDLYYQILSLRSMF